MHGSLVGIWGLCLQSGVRVWGFVSYGLGFKDVLQGLGFGAWGVKFGLWVYGVMFGVWCFVFCRETT